MKLYASFQVFGGRQFSASKPPTSCSPETLYTIDKPTMKFSLFIFTLFLSLIDHAQNCFEIHKIKSKILHEKRSVWVKLPKNYNEDSSYSVLYVLDAEDRFDLTYSITEELFENQNAIPELIVVGIPN